MTIEIITSRTIGRQILRHKSFSFSEFSQRYSAAQTFETYAGRSPAEKERQSSVEPLGPLKSFIFIGLQKILQTLSGAAYRFALFIGVSKECARFLLLETATTRMYMTGSIRSWIHFLQVRTEESTQLEHKTIAEAIRPVFAEALPVLGEVLFNGRQ